MNLRPALFLLAAAAVLACSPPPKAIAGGVPILDEAFETGRLEIVNDRGESVEFDVYLAREPEQHRRGLMFVRQMPAQTGMLFLYPDEAVRGMWMKNTYIPLDMIFARGDGSVSSVVYDTAPLSLTTRASVEPVRYVLELNAGAARRYQIGTKSRLIWTDP